MSTLYIRNGSEFREATTEEISSHPAVAARQRPLEGETSPGTVTFPPPQLLVGTYGI